MDDIKDRCGITGVRVFAHTFRHTFACIYLEKGGDIYKLSLLMGHSDIDVIQEYLKDFRKRAARQGHDKFSAVSAMEVFAKRKKRKSKE